MGDPNVPPHYVAKFKELLINIGFLSVREGATSIYIQDIIRRHVSVVADPTLLLDAAEWNELMAKETCLRTMPYILTYIIYAESADTPIFAFTEYIAQKLSLSITHIGFHFKQSKPAYQSIPVSEFLSKFKNANLVVSNTFHGTMFSVIFRKSFYIFKPHAGPTRVQDFLNRMNLSERCVESLEEAKGLPVFVDYETVEPTLRNLQSDSLKWLESAVNN
jgi:hypothetical protein